MNLNPPDESPPSGDELPGTPLTVGKHRLTAVLAASGMPLAMPLVDALRNHAAMGLIRRQLDLRFGRGPGLCEFEGTLLAPFVPMGLKDWPVWYIRLPDAWADDVPRLVAQGELQPHLMRDDQDPWYVAQWVSIVSVQHPSGWLSSARRIDVDERDVAWTISRGFQVGGVLVLIECAGRISTTAYPIDESLLCALQAGEGASSRNAQFDVSLPEVQAMTRALEDGCAPASDPCVLRLPVAHVGQTDEHFEQEAMERRVQDALDCLGPRVNCFVHDDGAIGPLATVADWWPAGLKRDRGTWLRLTVPAALHDRFTKEGMQARVEHVPPAGGAPAMVVVTLSSGHSLYAAEMPLRYDDLRRIVQSESRAGWLRIALVNLRNGRPLVTVIGWPPMDLLSTPFAHATAKVPDGVAGAVHPYAWRRAEALALELGEAVELHRCRVMPAYAC